MNKATLLTLPCLLATLLAPDTSRGEDFLLYTPKPAEGDKAPASPDEGILVRSVTVKRGDTLSDLSKKYLGRGSWFPQVLLFNSIKNPDLIITGDTLLVPVPAGQSAAEAEKAAPEKKHAKGGKRHAKARGKHRAVAKPEAAQPEAGMREALPHEPGKPESVKRESVKREAAPVKRETAKPEVSRPVRPEPAPLRLATPSEQTSYQQAKLAYLRGDYQKALELFTEFRSKYPSSTFSADVALYQADCMLHLSGE
jgi:hypothetical protein